MVDVAALESALHRAAGRAAEARWVGDQVAAEMAWAEAEELGRALDVATRRWPEDEWAVLAGSPDHG